MRRRRRRTGYGSRWACLRQCPFAPVPDRYGDFYRSARLRRCRPALAHDDTKSAIGLFQTRRYGQRQAEAAEGLRSAALGRRRFRPALQLRVRTAISNGGLARRAFAWFLGNNDLSTSLVDLETGSCRDGLHSDRPNENRGGESTVSYLLSRRALRQKWLTGTCPDLFLVKFILLMVHLSQREKRPRL